MQVASTSCAVLAPRTIFEQPHHVGRAEEVQADHVLRALGEGGDLVRGPASRCWRRGSRPACTTSSSVSNTCFLTSMSSNTASMTRSTSFNVVVAERRRDAAPCACSSSSCGQRALLQRALVVLADGAEALVERLLLHLEQHHRDAGVGEVHRDAAAHRAGADDADLAIGRSRRVFGHVGDLGRRALGREDVAQRRATPAMCISATNSSRSTLAVPSSKGLVDRRPRPPRRTPAAPGSSSTRRRPCCARTARRPRLADA